MNYSEYGSDFHFIESKEEATSSFQNIYPHAKLYFSGRVALFQLIKHGIEKYGWRKVYLPNYYCHEVSRFITQLPIVLSYYDDGPYSDGNSNFLDIDQSGNAIVKVNYFGVGYSSQHYPLHAILIEDHTHDLISDWALNSKAHYCFASLRKSIPVPTGGAVWSPKGFSLPDDGSESLEGNMATFMKLNAMLMKKMYLTDGSILKDDFRNLFLESEHLFKKHDTIGRMASFISVLLNRISLKELRHQRIINYNELHNLISKKKMLWPMQVKQHDCPFTLVLQFYSTADRDQFRKYLVSKKIYPAVLWPNQFEEKARDFSDKSLCIHCDFRYTAKDMVFISDIINNYANENKSYFSLGKASME
jgi:hypothetical protein